MRCRQHLSHGAGWCLGLLILLQGAGCASRYEDLKVFLQKHEHDVAAVEYRIEPPDMVLVSSPTCAEIDGDLQRIGPDGKISLKLLGEVQIAGMTPRESAAKLRELLAVYYVEPEVNVRVTAYESKKIFVFGEVASPGPRPFTGRDSVLDVLATTHLTRMAWGAQVKVIRPSASPEARHEVVVDVDRIMQTGDLQKNFLLEDGDIVYVPPTPLAWVGQRIQDVLFPVSGAAELYSEPATFIAATDYYKDRNSAKTYVRFSPGSASE